MAHRSSASGHSGARGRRGRGGGGGGGGGEHLRVLLGAREAGNQRHDGGEEPTAVELGGGALRCVRGGGESVVRCELLRGCSGLFIGAGGGGGGAGEMAGIHTMGCTIYRGFWIGS
jgi:hypothetical protein